MWLEVTIVVYLDPCNLEMEVLKRIARKLVEGTLVVYPTETCYGLGVNALDIEAVKRLRIVKKRPLDKPISIIVSGMEMIEKYGYLSSEAKILIEKFMPGPLTLVVKKKPLIPDIVNREGVSFRISSHPIASFLVKETGLPITTPSANPADLEPAYTAEKTLEYFNGRVDVIIDAGELPRVKPSTIVDIRSMPPKLIREGPITFHDILKALKKEKNASFKNSEFSNRCPS